MCSGRVSKKAFKLLCSYIGKADMKSLEERLVDEREYRGADRAGETGVTGVPCIVAVC